jgi:hypothetical protein
MANKKFKAELLNFISMMVGTPEGIPIFSRDFQDDWKQRVALAEAAAEIYNFYVMPEDEIDVIDAE